MLVEITIKNFAIIEELSLELDEGLNIISGETGSGKSIILKSLALLMGDKASVDILRTGCKQAIVEGLFDLSRRPDVLEKLNELGLEGDDDELIARRLITAQGKSRVYVNGHLCSLQILRDIISPLVEINGSTPPLIEMAGQHESKALLNKSYHLDVLDRYCGCLQMRKEFEVDFQKLSSLQREYLDLENQMSLREQRLDFLKFQYKEISSLNLTEGYELNIENDYFKAKNFNALMAYTQKIENELYSSDEAFIEKLHSWIQEGNEKLRDEKWQQRLELLTSVKAQLEDFVYELREWQRDLSENPMDVDSIEGKMSKWRKIQKKYGQTASEVLIKQNEISTEIDQLENHESLLQNMQKEISRLSTSLQQQAEKLHKSRSSGSLILIKKINDELKDLNMKGVQFGIHVEKLQELNSRGSSDVEFLIQVSKEDKFRPLHKIASGGELSRILLAMKKITGSSDLPRTYLFDEVDTGVSGETAEKVGNKLKAIALGQQVVCVTHLPQVAVFADSHFVISKIQKGKKVSMDLQKLNPTEREAEIARLISGTKVTNTSRQHAKQLLKDHQI
ncbi:MAG: DNA repair protein RecN [Bdellovibrionaceae bacterium]|nr:DNA repair protein RecN [Pseudobdellovibrionaceae bacterium]